MKYSASEQIRYISMEEYLIKHCSATLAGLKSANLFNYRFERKVTAEEEIELINNKLNDRGVYAEPLLWKESAVLIYVYRRKYIQAQLMQEGAPELLIKCGYTCSDMKECICCLKEKLCCCECFPHEIGIFLGYPLGDVIGFMHNKGKNCKCCGPWKVYCDETEAKKLFEKMEKCAAVYSRVFAEGKCISKMTVCS